MFKCGVKIDGKGIESDEEKAEKGREERENDGKKDGQYHLLKSLQARFKCGVKIGGKRARKARKGTESKMGNKHLLEAGKAMYVGARKARKVTERKMGNKHLLEVCKATHVKAGNARKVTEKR
jgi:hypothetical protein